MISTMYDVVKFDKSRKEDYLRIFDQASSGSVVCYCTHWNMTQEEIEVAAAFAQASDFIEEMEEKYETVIGERGVGLSGGQKQRISIARAVAKHAPILVMDDATSALDMETEREIQKELEQLNDTTKIIIAHRISAVRHADEIIYLKDGQIAERGTHEQLLEKKGLYYETYKVQYGEVK